MYNVWHLDTVSSYERQDRMARTERARLVRSLWPSQRSSLKALLADWWRRAMHVELEIQAGPSAPICSTLEFSR
jgi:hypothetical protein